MSTNFPESEVLLKKHKSQEQSEHQEAEQNHIDQEIGQFLATLTWTWLWLSALNILNMTEEVLNRPLAKTRPTLAETVNKSRSAQLMRVKMDKRKTETNQRQINRDQTHPATSSKRDIKKREVFSPKNDWLNFWWPKLSHTVFIEIFHTHYLEVEIIDIIESESNRITWEREREQQNWVNWQLESDKGQDLTNPNEQKNERLQVKYAADYVKQTLEAGKQPQCGIIVRLKNVNCKKFH